MSVNLQNLEYEFLKQRNKLVIYSIGGYILTVLGWPQQHLSYIIRNGFQWCKLDF